MSLFIQFTISITTLLVVQGQSNDITKLFKLGSHYRDVDQDFYRRKWDIPHVKSNYFTLPDNVLTLCFGIVIAYMTYIIIMFMVKPKLPAAFEANNNPGLQALLANHHFRHNAMPAKMKNLYDVDMILQEQSHIGKCDHIVTPVHSAKMKKNGKVLEL